MLPLQKEMDALFCCAARASFLFFSFSSSIPLVLRRSFSSACSALFVVFRRVRPCHPFQSANEMTRHSAAPCQRSHNGRQRRRRNLPLLLLLSAAAHSPTAVARVVLDNSPLPTQTGPVPAHIGTCAAAPRPTSGPEYHGGVLELFRRQLPYSPGQSVCGFLSTGPYNFTSCSSSDRMLGDWEESQLTCQPSLLSRRPIPL